MIDYVYEIVINDRRLTIRELKEAATISYELLHNILHSLQRGARATECICNERKRDIYKE